MENTLQTPSRQRPDMQRHLSDTRYTTSSHLQNTQQVHSTILDMWGFPSGKQTLSPELVTRNKPYHQKWSPEQAFVPKMVLGKIFHQKSAPTRTL